MDQNPWHSENASDQLASETPRVAPPPVEVAIRTMASDIASMTESGGGPPKPQSVTLPSFKQTEASESLPAPLKGGSEAGALLPPREAASENRDGTSRVSMLKYFILAASILIAAAILFFGSYYVLYPLLTRLTSLAPAVPLPTSTAPSAQARPSFEHRSFFARAVDGTFILKLSSSNAGLQASSQQLGRFLAGLAASSTFFELQPQSLDDKPLTPSGFLSSINGGVLEESFLVSAFNPDFTVFLYKDKNGLWPGYVFQLKANQTPLLFQPNAAKIESASSNWEDIFLEAPGVPAAAFRDALVSGQPVRVLNFSDVKSVLAYGWFFNKYLIISTSLDGLKQAIQRF